MFFLIQFFSKHRAVIGTAQMAGQGNNIDIVRITLTGLFKCLRGRTGGFRTVRARLHHGQKCLLVKCFIIHYHMIIHLKGKGDHLKPRILLQFLSQVQAAVTKNLIAHNLPPTPCCFLYSPLPRPYGEPASVFRICSTFSI